MRDEARTRIARLSSKLDELKRLIVPLASDRPRSGAGLLEVFDGRIYTGRFVGRVVDEELELDLTIEPRMARAALAVMLGRVFNVRITEAASRLVNTEAPLLLVLVALVWRSAVVRGFHHGPPSRRRNRLTIGRELRGSFDTAGTIALRMRGNEAAVASRERIREIDRLPILILDAAREALRRDLGPTGAAILNEAAAALADWVPLTPRGKQPAIFELLHAPIRFTPISESLRPAIELSRRILASRGLGQSFTGASPRTWGALIDMAELWELYVLRELRKELPSLELEHAARAAMTNLLLDDAGQAVERMAPDIVGRERKGGEIRLVVDAKYKRRVLLREDLYQVLAYQTRLKSPEAWLVYPAAVVDDETRGEHEYRRAEAQDLIIRTRLMQVGDHQTRVG
jgi:5-methylcytosine-specific restriction enzyme subunit McrC